MYDVVERGFKSATCDSVGFIPPCHWTGDSDLGGYVRGVMSGHLNFTLTTAPVKNSEIPRFISFWRCYFSPCVCFVSMAAWSRIRLRTDDGSISIDVHGTDWRCTGGRFPLPEFTGRVDGPWTRVHFWHPSTRAVNSGSGNRHWRRCV